MLGTDVSGTESSPVKSAGVRSLAQTLRPAVMLAAGVFLFIVVFYRLPDYPLTWFDEGSHLHVPKTLVQYGVYADISSDGFRYYGPTIGVGPTVMLPIAAAFRAFGIGLMQARVVMAFYLLATIVAFWFAARQMGTSKMSAVATVLFVVTPGVALIEYGRQVLGEVPGLFFLLFGLALWLAAWEKSSWTRLVLVGMLVGLAIVTKSQYLLIVVPSLGTMWVLNMVYYRSAPHRLFIVPGLVAGVLAAMWQAYLVLYLGPSTASENFALLRQASAGAAFVFSPELMRNSLDMLVSRGTFLGALVPALLYGIFLALPRNRDGQRWSLLVVLVLLNLLWYVFASIGWSRYAFLGLSLACIPVARFFADLTDDFSLSPSSLWGEIARRQMPATRDLLAWTALMWLLAMLVIPGALVLRKVVLPGDNTPLAMAAYIDAHVPREAVIETWEAEMGFLTDHGYHYPPAGLLDMAVGHIWRNGPSPSEGYDFRAQAEHSYVLVGPLGGWVGVYPEETLREHYRSVAKMDRYELFVRVD